MKTPLIILGTVVLVIGAFFALNAYIYQEKQQVTGTDYKNAEYVIDGRRIQLQNGVAEMEVAPGSASKVVTRFFGNEVFVDLNDDGRDDVVFLLTQNTGGSGEFYYVVAALNTDKGYVGSQALLLGDRIAPQSTVKGEGKVVIVNYADRAPSEPFTNPPTIGKSMYLLLDPAALQFGEVVADFEGEADPSRMSLDMKEWVWQGTLMNDGREVKPKTAGSFSVTFVKDGTFSAKTDCNSMGGKYTLNESQITVSDIFSTKMYCEGSQETEFAGFLTNASVYRFTSKGELILDLKFDSGSVTFR